MHDYNRYMLRSYVMAERSRDPSTQLGAILVSKDDIEIGHGWNHFTLNVDKAHWSGPKEGKYARVAHAEVSAILMAARQGLATLDSTLVCGWSACANCAKYIVEAGISKLVRHKDCNAGEFTNPHWYEDCAIGDEILTAGNVEIIEIDPVPTHLHFRRNGNLWPNV